MKTLEEIKEEIAERYRYKSWKLMIQSFDPLLPSATDDTISKLAEGYANEVSKALLEEAAEKIDKEYKKNDTNLKNWYESGYCDGLDIAERIVRSFIPKEKTTTK